MPNSIIGAILEHYGAMMPYYSGRWVSMNCPFHKDSRASARVNQELNAFTCLAGCTNDEGKPMSGDAVKLVRLKEHLSYEDACEWIKKEIGEDFAPVPQAVHGPGKRRKRDRSGWKAVPRRAWDS